ncbi:MAG TPA: MaoC family dehydratase, partial [Dongiaceae bacterium]
MTDAASPGSKTNPGRFFEDFRLGETIAHATPRSLGPGERALYIALTGSRFALQSSHDFARRVGYASAPLDDLLVFHIVFGRSVPDISLNAVANLGYAEVRFGAAVHDGDSLTARSTVLGLKENSSRETGTVYVRTEGLNQRGDTVLSFVRWVMVRKRDKAAPAPAAVVPPLAESAALDLPALLPETIELAG